MAREKGSVVLHVLIEYLADEQWHPFSDAVRVGMAAVPPGVALRLAERERNRIWLREHPGEPLTPRLKNNDTDYLIRVGSRRYAVDVLRNVVFERSEDKSQIRLNPKRKYQYNGLGEFMLHRYRDKPTLTPEQEAKIRSERSRQAWRTRQIRKGLDPDAPTQRELRERRKAELEAMTPEQRKEFYAERARKAYASRRAKKKEGNA